MVTDNMPKSEPAYMALKTVIGKTSLVAIGGDFWKKLRKVFNPAFAPSHLDTQIPAILEESQIFVDRLKEVANTDKTILMAQLTMVRAPPSSVLIVVFDYRHYSEGHFQY